MRPGLRKCKCVFDLLAVFTSFFHTLYASLLNIFYHIFYKKLFQLFNSTTKNPFLIHS